jgi:hypothetical protein
MIEINLVPDVKQELIKAQRIRSTVITVSIIIGFVSIAVVVLLAIYVFAIQTVRNGIEDTSINDGSAKLQKVTDLSKTLTIQNQLTQIDQLNSQKSIDSRLFDVLEAIIPPAPNNVSISALSLDSVAGTVTIQGQAANGYSAAEVFKKTIEGAQVKFVSTSGNQSAPLASDISLSNTSYGVDSTGAEVLRFTISFTYNTDVFSPASSNVSIGISNSGNATDSFLGVPTSIFAIPASDLKGVNQ